MCYSFSMRFSVWGSNVSVTHVVWTVVKQMWYQTCNSLRVIQISVEVSMTHKGRPWWIVWCSAWHIKLYKTWHVERTSFMIFLWCWRVYYKLFLWNEVCNISLEMYAFWYIIQTKWKCLLLCNYMFQGNSLPFYDKRDRRMDRWSCSLYVC